MDIKSEIRARMAEQAPFGVWTPMDFLDLGLRDAVDQALSRMTATSDIRRVTRGLYDLPRLNTLTGKPTNPDHRRVIDALARRDQARMLVDGLTAANDLGLSDAVPAKIAVHTDARLRPIKLGAQTITFKRPPLAGYIGRAAPACALSRPSTGCAACSAAIMNGSRAAWRPSWPNLSMAPLSPQICGRTSRASRTGCRTFFGRCYINQLAAQSLKSAPRIKQKRTNQCRLPDFPRAGRRRPPLRLHPCCCAAIGHGRIKCRERFLVC